MPLDFQSIAAIVFLAVFSVVLYLKRKNLQKHGAFPFFYALLYRTKFGLRAMDKYAQKFGKLLRFLGYAGIVIGFLGMAFLAFTLVQNLIDIFTKPEAPPGVGLVLPIEAKGVVFVPFFYWIISIFIVALVHEYAHGVIARAHNIKVKSSGFGFLGVIIPLLPVAFVEPDEKKLGKRPYSQQLSVFAAGPFSNILLGLILLGFAAFAFSPLLDSMTELTGAKISGLTEGFPAASSGLAEGEVIKQIDDAEIKSVGEFSDYLREKKPGSTIDLETDRNSYSIRLAQSPLNESAGYLGVYVRQDTGIKESFIQRYGSFMPNVILWVAGLLSWLIILNLGIGLFNLIPIGPIDGGRMMHLVLLRVFKNGEKANRVWHSISLVFLLIVIVIVVKACTL